MTNIYNISDSNSNNRPKTIFDYKSYKSDPPKASNAPLISKNLKTSLSSFIYNKDIDSYSKEIDTTLTGSAIRSHKYDKFYGQFNIGYPKTDQYKLCGQKVSSVFMQGPARYYSHSLINPNLASPNYNTLSVVYGQSQLSCNCDAIDFNGTYTLDWTKDGPKLVSSTNALIDSGDFTFNVSDEYFDIYLYAPNYSSSYVHIRYRIPIRYRYSYGDWIFWESLILSGQMSQTEFVKIVNCCDQPLLLAPTPTPSITPTTSVTPTPTPTAHACSPFIPTTCASGEILLSSTSGSSWGVPTLINSNTHITSGDIVTINVKGCATCYKYNNSCNVGPNGYLGNGTISGNWMVCVGNIDAANNNTKSIGNLSELFVVGENLTFTANSTGYLYLGIYDGAWADNEGNYCASVTISQVAPTPTPTRTNTPTPTPSLSSSSTNINLNKVNYRMAASWDGYKGGHVTTVGTNGGPSYYGTYDQSGQVYEWTDANITPENKILRGGFWSAASSYMVSSSSRPGLPSNTSDDIIGCRIASSNNILNLNNFVLVSDINNTNDLTGYGSVSYEYYIGKYVITNCEYVEFLNSVATSTDTYSLYKTGDRCGIIKNNNYYSIKTDYSNKPALYLTWFDCARYCNWLHNGKPSGSQSNNTTEDGSYTLNGATSGNTVPKNTGAKYWIPTENEWYKAAFYKGNGTNKGYWKYATQSDADPSIVKSDIHGNGNGNISTYSCNNSITPTPTPTKTSTLTPTPTPTTQTNCKIVLGNQHSIHPNHNNPLDTNIDLVSGENLTITATGLIDIGWGKGPWGPDGITSEGIDPANGFTYMALLGRIGSGPIFKVGSSYSETVTNSGRLYLFFNDTPLIDNSGSFTACITKSSGPTPTPTRTLTPTPTSSLPVIQNLFDKSSFDGLVSEPYLTYLKAAADRWSSYIRYNPSVYSGIQSLYFDAFGSTWQGLKLDPDYFSLLNDITLPMLASSGPLLMVDLTQPISKLRNSVSFQLNINNAFLSSYTSDDWIDILTHELGHALGIGVYWDNTDISPPIVNNFLDGTEYPYVQAVYNSLSSLSRNKTPLESSGTSGGTANSHWENDFRTDTDSLNYFGLSNELMIGYFESGSNLILSQLSIKALVQHGYEEINPGASEGIPNMVVSIGAYSSDLTSQKLDNIFHHNCTHNIDYNTITTLGTVNR